MKYRRAYSARTDEKTIPRYEARLRKHILRVPSAIRECSGIVIFGRRIKSIAFTTDLCIVRNMDADAVLAVYPFTPPAGHHPGASAGGGHSRICRRGRRAYTGQEGLHPCRIRRASGRGRRRYECAHQQ